MLKFCCLEMEELESNHAIHEGKEKGTYELSIYAYCFNCRHHGEQSIKIIYCPFCGKRLEPNKKK